MPLHKMLYGLKNSPVEWFEDLSRRLVAFPEVELVQSDVDPCVWTWISDDPVWILADDNQTRVMDAADAEQRESRCVAVHDQGLLVGYQKIGANGEPLTHRLRLGLYVDDLITGYTKGSPVVDQLVESLKQDGCAVTREPMQWCLNCEVTRDRRKRTWIMSQLKHTEKIVDSVFGAGAQLKRGRVPMKDGYFPVATQAPDVLLDADEASVQV